MFNNNRRQSHTADGRHVAAPGLIRTLALTLTLALFCSPAAHGQCSYSVQEIVGPNCPFDNPAPLIARGLNIHGEVVGYYADCSISALDHPFYWSEATGRITLPRPDGATTTRALDINDHGQIVGETLFPGVAWRGFMYDMNTNEFHLLEPKFGVGMAVLNAINNAGVAVGARSITDGGSNPHNAVIWDTNTGEITDLGVIWAGNSTANAINEAMQVVGSSGVSAPTSRGFIHERRTIVLPVIPDGISSLALDIARESIVVGGGHIQIDGQTFARGGIWNEMWIEVIDPPDGFHQIAARHINDMNQVVLQATQSGGIPSPFLWQNGELHNLNDLALSGPQLTNTGDINNNGQILTIASTRGVLLTPVDVPLGDLNFDCRVDGHDLLILLDSWGPVPRSRRGSRGSDGIHSADLNGDGVVDGLDLLILLSNWTN